MTGVAPGLRGAVREEMTMLVRQGQGHRSQPQGKQGKVDEKAKASSSPVQPPVQQPNEDDPGGATPPPGGGTGPISRPDGQPVERKHPGPERGGAR